MRTSILMLFTTFCLCAFKISAQQNGDLDSTFNLTGKIVTDFNNGTDGATSVLVQTDGKILVAGYSSVGNNYQFALSRYEINGSPDTSFGGTGEVLTDFAPGYDYAASIALQSDGKIVAGGIKWNGTGGDNALIRYNSDGSLDTTFGPGGKVSNAVGIADAGINSVLIQSDGKIVAAGICTTPGNTGHDFGLTRYNSDGSIDSTFGINGIIITDFSNSADYPFTAALQTDGKILTGGASGQDPIFDFAIVRYDTIGNPDTTFGINGKVTTDFGKPDEWASSMAIQNDGKIVLAGYSGSPYKVALARYTTSGILDTTFNTTGKVLTAITSHDEANALSIQPDGKILIAGVSYNGSNQDFCLVRYLADGSLDSNFSSNGSLTTDFGTNADKAKGVAIQTDGKIIAAGVANNDFAVARYLTNLSTGIVDFASMNNSLFIYPNPVTENATLTYTLNKTEIISIRLIDPQGKVVMTFIENQMKTQATYEQAISLPENLAHGAYFIVISNENEHMSIKIVR